MQWSDYGNTECSDMTCKMCIERGKTWNGDDPKCAFDGEFKDNWNCATLSAIRDLYDERNKENHEYIEFQYCDDQKYMTIKIDHLLNDALALWVTWYKSRGRTEAMWLLSEYGAPRLPTEKELVAIINSYKP